MAIRLLFRAALFTFLSLLQPIACGHCQQFPRTICRKHAAFVPGHSFIGEGVDITTLEGKGAYVVDTSRWQGPNGTCTLCRNPLMEGQLQKLPLAAVDWRVHSDCRRHMSSSMEHSDVDVANAVAKEVKNDWKSHLGLHPEEGIDEKMDQQLPKAQVAFAASHSWMTLYAHERSRQDSHVFFRQEVSCEYYSCVFHVSPLLLASDFSWAVGNLPRKHDPEEYQHFIDIYGTHYISQVQLGGQVRHLIALQTCAMAWKDLSAADIKQCFSWEISLGYQWLSGARSLGSNCKDLWRGQGQGKFFNSYHMQHTDVMGGDKQVEMLFLESGEVQRFSEWMESAKAKPGLVSYSLLPLHTLLRRRDPRRDLLRQAIVTHIRQRALIRNCPPDCPHWSSQEHCACMCRGSSVTNKKCCAREEGMAHLKFHIDNGSNLWGDRFTATDAYVKVFFQGQVQQTKVIGNDNDPWWQATLDFGTVTLSGHNRFAVELWDNDVWHDDLLQRCWEKLEAGINIPRKCHASYGYVAYSYSLECGRTMGGAHLS
uniref:Perforin-1-like n=1 Tax=Varanus komodoensis TaxID=61221 RepID=A0A8D2IPJ6_VARKO